MARLLDDGTVEDPVLTDTAGFPIYEGDTYYEFDGGDLIVRDDQLSKFAQVADEDCEVYEDSYGEPIYVGDTYYVLGGYICTEETLWNEFQKRAKAIINDIDPNSYQEDWQVGNE